MFNEKDVRALAYEKSIEVDRVYSALEDALATAAKKYYKTREPMETVIDRATYTDPHHLSEGIRDVFVNGTAVVRDGVHTNACPGMRLNGPGYVARQA